MLNKDKQLYCFECYPMPWTELELGIDFNDVGNNSIDVCIELTTEEVKSIVSMMQWAWDNDWFENSTSERACAELIEKHSNSLYKKVYSKAHMQFCERYPNSQALSGFGEYEIFIPDEILDMAR